MILLPFISNTKEFWDGSGYSCFPQSRFFRGGSVRDGYFNSNFRQITAFEVLLRACALLSLRVDRFLRLLESFLCLNYLIIRS